MPIDPTIIPEALAKFSNNALAGMKDMYDQEKDRAQIDEIQSRTAVNQSVLSSKQREAEDEARIQSVWQRYADDVPTAIKETAKINPVRAREIGQKYGEERANWALQASRESKTKADQQTADTMLLQSAIGTTPENLAKVKAFIVHRNPEIAPLIADLTDPNDPRLPKLVVSGVDAGKVYELQAKHLDDMAKGQTDGSFLRGIAGILSVTPQDHWPEILQGAAPHLGPAQTSALAAMSPAQLQAASLEPKEAVTTKETGRHNLVAEAEDVRTHKAHEAIAIRGQNLQGTGGGGPITAGDSKLIDGLMKNPAMYAGLTPTVKARIAGELMARGFNPGGSADGKPANGQQRRAFNFFNRAKQSDEEIQQLEPTIAKLGAVGQVRLGYQGPGSNWVQTQTGQAYTAAQRAFTEARLRKDSGAAIPEHEYVNDRQTYFAQPGDTNATLAQKARARAGLLASLAYESGPALNEFYGDDAPALMDDLKQRSVVGKAGAAAPTSDDGSVMIGGFKVRVKK